MIMNEISCQTRLSVLTYEIARAAVMLHGYRVYLMSADRPSITPGLPLAVATANDLVLEAEQVSMDGPPEETRQLITYLTDLLETVDALVEIASAYLPQAIDLSANAKRVLIGFSL